MNNNSNLWNSKTPYCNLAYVAFRCGCSVNTVRRHIEKNNIPTYRPMGNRFIVITREDADRLINNPPRADRKEK